MHVLCGQFVCPCLCMFCHAVCSHGNVCTSLLGRQFPQREHHSNHYQEMTNRVRKTQTQQSTCSATVGAIKATICVCMFCACFVSCVHMAISAVYEAANTSSVRVRPYQHDSTASRLLSEVKHARAQLVLRWGTTLESWVLFSFYFCFKPWPTPACLHAKNF